MAKKVQWTKTEPWPDPVDGEVLADEIMEDLRAHVYVGDHERAALVLWMFHAHSHAAFQKSPYLSIYSTTPGCGKSTTGRVVASHVPCPFTTSNLSRPVLYRLNAPDGMKPTLFIDEADCHVFRDEGAVSILNAGHDRSTSLTHRVDDEYDVVEFDTWMPKVTMSVGQPPRTIVDRSIPIVLRRMRAHESVKDIPANYESFVEHRRRKLARWAADMQSTLSAANPELPTKLRNRARDNWRPLIAIGDLISPQWANLARASAMQLGAQASQDEGERLLLDCIDVLVSTFSRDFISTRTLLASLNELPNSPWGEMNYNRGMTAQQLAKRLFAFDITPQKVNRMGNENVRGYVPLVFVNAAKQQGIDLTAG